MRELRNTCERIVILRVGNTITVDDYYRDKQDEQAQSKVVNLPKEEYPFSKIEEELAIQALRHAKGNITKAAELLHTPRHILNIPHEEIWN